MKRKYLSTLFIVLMGLTLAGPLLEPGRATAGQTILDVSYDPTRNDEDALTRAIIALASEYGRYGYRRITALLRGAGWTVGKDRVLRAACGRG
jgi:hypothetical protein